MGVVGGNFFISGWEIEGEDTTVRTMLNIVRAMLWRSEVLSVAMIAYYKGEPGFLCEDLQMM